MRRIWAGLLCGVIALVGTVACAPFTHSGASGRTKSFCMSMMTRAMFMMVPWLLVDLQSHFCGFLEKKHIGTGKAFLFTIGCETGTALLLYLFVKKTSSLFYWLRCMFLPSGKWRRGIR